MIRALVGKELRQHAVTFTFLFALLLVGLAGITGHGFLRRMAGTGLEGVRLLLITLVPLACIMLGHVLVATEFGRRTQLFLDALPLPRWRLIAIKFLLGLFVLMAGCAAALTLELTSERATSTITPQFILILSAKTATWLIFIYSAFFAHALTGRYRIPLVIASVLILVNLQQEGLPVGEFAAFQLVDPRFAYEAHQFPTRDLLITLGVSLCLIGSIFWLGLARDATLAGLLAKRMSGPEKAFFTFATLAGLVAMGYMIERREQMEVVRMPGAVEVERGLVRVAVSAAVSAPSSAEQAAVQRIASRTAAEVESLADYLGCRTMPPIFIVHRRDFAAGHIENGELKPKQGLMLRVNVAGESFREAEFFQRMIQEVLLLRSAGRAAKEPNAWVLAGLPVWWTEKRRKPDDPPSTIALPRQPVELSRESLNNWLMFSKTAGDAEAKTIARIGLETLESSYGEKVCRGFLQKMFAEDIPKDVRGWFRDVSYPMSRRFESTAGVTVEAFVREWNESLLLRSTKTAQAQ